MVLPISQQKTRPYYLFFTTTNFPAECYFLPIHNFYPVQDFPKTVESYFSVSSNPVKSQRLLRLPLASPSSVPP